ncbi:MAG TPA: hypothetical protein VM580_25980 [Labilithrix sp.]|jgi:hypothetical protein|nr:hypothetical protein [Labilithrix sp.]
MTYIVKTRGAGGLVVAEYECPTHGRFTVTVQREANGDPPESTYCPATADAYRGVDETKFVPPACARVSPWRPSSVRGWVKRGEVARGKSDAQERPTWMSTRELGEGMSMAEWQAKRDAAWEEHDRKEDKELFG